MSPQYPESAIKALAQSHEELSELLEVQEQEIAVLRELTVRLLQALHTRQIVSIEEIADAAEMGAASDVDDPHARRHAMLPAVLRLLRQAGDELDAGQHPSGTSAA
ncbi:hypothetical protein [Pseudacidovorax sp. RU35E]|uniref:hypothetical protein n=1 Tax=Pseudacidovorax sp. RU35E TaxID=1907403 RepID=UPI0009545F0D|nr:hypothetical protein [Pseudacidovorax sp. RU35E]SIR72992.1 hypothetical protein SAMN05880557_11820 [Pseudacidovorax sp. RU35E]